MYYDLINIATTAPAIQEEHPEPFIQDYRDVLERYGLSPVRVDFHLQVGEIKPTQGWILHISVVRSQIDQALRQIIPVLLSINTPFKIVKDRDTAVSLLDGNLGLAYIGKIFSIYPDTDEQAVHLVKALVQLTTPFKGPSILTDIHLGGNIYTRYGSFNPIIRADAGGNPIKYIYDAKGELSKDITHIPFQMPIDISWPFDSVASNKVPATKKILHDRYKPLFYLKIDPRGNVIKAHYVHSLFRIKTCVIKQAKRNMWSDNHGRDMVDRLLWQEELYHQLSGLIRKPKLLEVFEENGDTYLAMECIKAKSIFDNICDHINPNCQCWELWPKEKQMEVLDYLLKIGEIVQKLHDAKVVHRDVTPVNFLVDKRKDLIVIDDELAYSIEKGKPYPPFDFGTHGFISPEQANTETPTIKEDIYGLGATIITVLTGIPPLAFDVSDPAALQNNLAYFIKDQDVVAVVVSCLSRDPAKRPTAPYVSNIINEYKQWRIHRGKTNDLRKTESLKGLDDLINGALKGLVTPPMSIHRDLWQSKIQGLHPGLDRTNNGFGKSAGLYQGMAGSLYTVAKAKLSGFDIASCIKAYHKNWNYLEEKYLKELPLIPPGMAGGAAGIAIALAKGMEAGLIDESKDNKARLQQCLEISNERLDLQDGIAGQGMAAIICSAQLDEDFLDRLLKSHFQILKKAQDKGGTWVMFKDGSRKATPAASLYQGNTGITLFLLSYYARRKDPLLLECITKSLSTLKSFSPALKKRYERIGFRAHLLDGQLRDGYKGAILTFIRAYEVLQIPAFKILAEDLLLLYPSCPVHEDFAQQYGLSGLGELYLKASNISVNDEWKRRAEWIAGLLQSTSYREESGGRYWLTNNETLPTADLMVGNSGIIHFLINFSTNFKKNQNNNL